MAKIKKIRQMQPNGQFSDYIPIGVDAKYVDLEYNNNNVENILKKKPYYFNNIEEMKNCKDLIVGDMAITLGYYEANDGGGATYRIRKKVDTDKEDNGSIHFLQDNLVAELIIENGANVKQFGAKGDGINDDTTYIQTAINTLRTKILSSDIANVNMVLFPAGKYKITSTIVVSPFVKLKTIGYVALLSYVSNGACLHFAPQSNDFKTSIGNKQDWFRGPWLNGEAGLIIKYMGEDNTNATGIKIGTDTNIGELLCCSRFSMNDCRLQGFNIALLYNYYNVYIGAINRFSFESNKVGVQYGSVAGTVVNSGEKMSYTDCLFASNQVSVKWLCDGMYSYFINTSFDFNKCIFHDPNNKGYHDIVVSNSHIEGNGSTDTTIPRGIVYGKMQMSQIKIHDCCIYAIDNVKLFTVGVDEACGYNLSFENNKLLFLKNNHDVSVEYLADERIIPSSYFCNSYSHDSKGRIFNDVINLVQQDFASLSVGSVDASTTKKIGNLDISYSNNVSLSNGITIDNDNPLNKKSISVELANTEASGSIQLRTDYIPVLPNKIVALKSLTKGTSCNILVNYYDSNKTGIGDSGNYTNNTDLDKSSWYIQSTVKKVRIPRNCYYIKVTYQCGITTEYPTIKIGNLYCQYE